MTIVNVSPSTFGMLATRRAFVTCTLLVSRGVCFQCFASFVTAFATFSRCRERYVGPRWLVHAEPAEPINSTSWKRPVTPPSGAQVDQEGNDVMGELARTSG